MKRRFISFCIIASMLILKPCVTLSADCIDIRDLHFVDSNDDYIFYNSEETDGYARALIKYSGTKQNVALVSAFYKGDSLCDIDYTSSEADESTREIKSKKITIPTGCTAKIMLFSKPFTLVGKPYLYRSEIKIPEKTGEYLKASDYEKELTEALAYLNTQTGGKVFEYYKTLYDAETSFFYSTVSGKESYGYYPNIEATAQVLDKINGYGGSKKVKDYLTDEQKEKMLTYLASMYHPEADKFYNPNAPYGVATDERLGRDNNYWVGYILGFCGISRADFMTKYNLVPAKKETEQVTLLSNNILLMANENSSPSERLKATSTVEEFKDTLEIIWQKNLEDGKHPYSLGDSFGTFKKIASDKGEEYLNATNRFLVDKQSAVTGLWGRDGKEDTEVSYQSTSAAMKFASCFKNLGLPYANYEKMVKNCIKVILSDEEPKYIVYAWNPISAMKQAMSSFGKNNVPEDFIKPIIAAGPEIIYKTVEKFEKFKMPDGGYSYHPGYAMEAAASMPVGLGLYESDIDGTGKINGVRTDIQTLLSINPYVKIFTDEELNGFFTALQNAKPTVKNTNKPYENDFEHYDITEDKKPDDWTEVFKGSNTRGSVRVVQNPKGDGKCIRIDGDSSTMIQARTGGFSLSSEKGETQTVEFDIFFPGGKKLYYYIALGNSYAVRLRADAGNRSDGLFSLAGVELAVNTWHTIKVEYLYNNGDATVKLYIGGQYIEDDRSLDVTPKKSIACFSVTGDSTSVGEIYIDNLKAYVQ